MNDLDAHAGTHLRRAVALADDAGAQGNRPFGAVAVSASGAVVAEGLNTATTSGDPTAHAELVAIRAAWLAGAIGALDGATMYASGEPCPMCAAAMVWAGIGRIVFAASARDFGAILTGGPEFHLTCAEVIATSDAAVEVSGPHLGSEALAPFHRFVAGAADQS